MAGSVLFFETFVLVESSGIFSNFGAESPPHRQAAKRYASPYDNRKQTDRQK